MRRFVLGLVVVLFAAGQAAGADGRDEIVGANIAPMPHFNGSVGRNDSNGKSVHREFSAA